MKRAIFLATVLCSLPVPAQDTDKAPAQTLPDSWLQSLRWRSIGPATMSGRMIDIAVYEKDPTTFWIATASGGLLKTTNNGITFEHQFDHENTVSLGAVDVAQSNPKVVWVGTGENNPRNSVSFGDGVYKSTDGGKTWKHMGLKRSFQTGDIIIHPKNPDIVYVGALGRLYGPNAERGLFKTTDGGKSWRKVLFVDDKTGVIDMAMHPRDPNTLLVATYERQRDGFDTNDPAKKIAPGSGLYRTTDGGKTFKKITEGLPTGKLGRIGLDYWQKDPNVVFAIVESEMVGKAGAKVGWPGVATSDAETGAKVGSVTKDGPAAKAGLKAGDIILMVGTATVLSSRQFEERIAQHEVGDKVRLEVARDGKCHEFDVTLAKRPARTSSGRGRRGRGRSGSRPFGTRLGGQVANVQKLQGKDGHEHGGVYRSDDGGLSWKRINSINPRPMYFSKIRVDPQDDQRLYVLGVSMARSKDGGKTFTNDAGRGVHSDQHALWIDPKDGRHMILGTDGGAYVTHDRCGNWAHLNHMALGQFYHVGVGPRRDYWVYGGLQDNGSWGAPHRNPRGSGPVNESWIRIGGGDGFLCLVDRNDPDQIYYESQNGNMSRTNLRTMERGSIRPSSGRGRGARGAGRGRGERSRYRFNWKTPFALSHHNSRIYYCAGNFVFRSLDRGNDLKKISPEITNTVLGSATALSESPRDPDVLYVGTDDGALWGTRDGGKTWQNLFAPAADSTDDEKTSPGATSRGTSLAELVPGPRWVSSLEASHAATGRVYVCLDGHRSNDDDPYVFVSEDYGQSWTSLRGNLPWGSTRVVREDMKNADVLYAGTEFGIWVSINRGKDWTHMNSNLPTVAVHEIAQHWAGDIVAGTHGRSIWIVDGTPIRQLSEKTIAADAHLYAPNAAVRWVTKHRTGSSGGARRFTGTNPSSEAEVYYSLGKPARSVTLTVRDKAGNVLSTLSSSTKKGLHRATWNLRRQPSAADRAATEKRLQERFGADWRRFLRFFNNRQPAVDLGKYDVVLEVDGKTFRQEVEVQPDPNFPKMPAQRGRFFEEEERRDN